MPYFFNNVTKCKVKIPDCIKYKLSKDETKLRIFINNKLYIVLEQFNVPMPIINLTLSHLKVGELFLAKNKHQNIPNYTWATLKLKNNNTTLNDGFKNYYYRGIKKDNRLAPANKQYPPNGKVIGQIVSKRNRPIIFRKWKY